MLDPSDDKQRNTLVSLVWLLIIVYFYFSITGFRHLSCQPAPPAAKWDALAPAEHAEPWDDRQGPGLAPPAPKPWRAFP